MPVVLELDLDELAGLGARLDVEGKAMERAAQAAANRAVRWARVQLQRGMAARLRVPQGALKGRLRALSAGRGRATAAVWIALRPLNIARARPRRTAGGLSAGGKDFGGAFLGRGRYGGTVAMRRKSAARTPLQGVSLDVHREAVPYLELRAWPELQAEFLRLYRTELARRRGRP